ncbi:MAG: hypothetical protein LBJ10_08965, partial [Clostridiales bacterium]|nr:hypothetical protein [Clostridiales bacterium]
MKRSILSAILILALCASLATPALAAPEAREAMGVGVYASSPDPAVYTENVPNGAVAEAAFSLRGANLHDVGAIYMQLSVLASEVDPGAATIENAASF